jgi:hypothetical protein
LARPMDAQLPGLLIRMTGSLNCPDQVKVYTPLLNIIAEVKSLCGC